jgi:phosphatidylserine decarboxylase
MSAVSYATAQIIRMLPRAWLGQAVGTLAERPWSPALGRAFVGLYSRLYDVELEECSKSGPWASFDEFFTRSLRSDARSIDGDPCTILSPADGQILSAAGIEEGAEFVVKGRPYSVEELVGASEARTFEGGSAFVIYLSPRDYHRVHSPVSGLIRRIRSMPGDCFPVNDVGMRHVPNLFCRNRRVAIELDAQDPFGRVTIVMVVAMIVGRITTIGIYGPDVPIGDHGFEPPLRVGRGDEIGVFHLGSTVVLLVEKHASSRWLMRQGPVRYGQALIRAAEQEASSKDGRARGELP